MITSDGVIVDVRGYLGYDADAASDASGIDCSSDVSPSKTQQQFAEDADINTIVRRFGLTGQLPENLDMPVSGDFEDATDFQSALNLVTKAREEFLSVPADIRARFGNDPGALMMFLGDDRNRDEAVRLGLVNKPLEVTRDVVSAIDELAAKLTVKP